MSDLVNSDYVFQTIGNEHSLLCQLNMKIMTTREVTFYSPKTGNNIPDEDLKILSKMFHCILTTHKICMLTGHFQQWIPG